MTRLDHYVLDRIPELSRSYINRLITDGKVLVNDGQSRPGYRLKHTDRVQIDYDPLEHEQIADIDLPIIYEDDDVLVVDKPAGVISHARGKYWNEPSVASFVRQKTGQTGDRAGIVHRLDRVTSGVMICAKNPVALSFLQKQFSSRKVEKTYIAIVSGHLSPQEAIIDIPIARNPKKPQTFRGDPTGKDAQTSYEVVKSIGAYDKVVLRPKTGRTHQIRVHLRESGHPIVGDSLYGGPEADRLYLHASSIEAKLPSGNSKIFKSPLPKSFDKLLTEPR